MWQYVPGPNIALGGARPTSKDGKKHEHHQMYRSTTEPGGAASQSAMDRISAMYERIDPNGPNQLHHYQQQSMSMSHSSASFLPQGVKHQTSTDVVVTKLQRLRPFTPVYKPVSVVLDRNRGATQPTGGPCAILAPPRPQAPARLGGIPRQQLTVLQSVKTPAAKPKKVKKKKKKTTASGAKRQAAGQAPDASSLHPPLPPLPTSKYAWLQQGQQAGSQQQQEGKQLQDTDGSRDQDTQPVQAESLPSSRPQTPAQQRDSQAACTLQPVNVAVTAKNSSSKECSPSTGGAIRAQSSSSEQQQTFILLPSRPYSEPVASHPNSSARCACAKVVVLREQGTQTEPELMPLQQPPQQQQERLLLAVPVITPAQPSTAVPSLPIAPIQVAPIASVSQQVHHVPTGFTGLGFPGLDSCSPLTLSYALQQPSPQLPPAPQPCLQQARPRLSLAQVPTAPAVAAHTTSQVQVAPAPPPQAAPAAPALQARPRLSLADELRQMGVPIDGSLAELLAASPLPSPTSSEAGDDAASAWSWEKELRKLGITD